MKHFFREIPGWFDFEEVYRSAVKAAPDKALFIEIGSWYGKSTAFLGVEIINSGKHITVLCVDAWDADLDKGINEKYSKELFEMAFTAFQRNVQPFSFVKFVKAPSAMLATLIVDSCADFIFIDGAHDYGSVLKDIQSWTPKLKPAGILAGHDITKEPVRQALKDCGIDYMVEGNSWVRMIW